MRGLIILLAAMLAADDSEAQSDKTCVAYMEADDAFRQAMEQAHAYSEYLAVKQRADEAARQAQQLEKQADVAVRKSERGTDSSKSKLAALKALKASLSATEAAQEALELLIAVRDKLLAALEPANDRRTEAHMAAYKGPVSDNPRVMAKLIVADRERCRERLER